MRLPLRQRHSGESAIAPIRGAPFGVGDRENVYEIRGDLVDDAVREGRHHMASHAPPERRPAFRCFPDELERPVNFVQKPFCSEDAVIGVPVSALGQVLARSRMNPKLSCGHASGQPEAPAGPSPKAATSLCRTLRRATSARSRRPDRFGVRILLNVQTVKQRRSNLRPRLRRQSKRFAQHLAGFPNHALFYHPV